MVSLVSPLFNLWRNIGLFDTWPGVIIPLVSFSLPLSIYVLSAFFREIPWEMEQAAQVDGATAWQAFRKVIVPLATPASSPRPSSRSSPDGTTSLSASPSPPPSGPDGAGRHGVLQRGLPVPVPITAIAAAAVVVTVPIIIMVLIFQRRIVAGLTNGAVKG